IRPMPRAGVASAWPTPPQMDWRTDDGALGLPPRIGGETSFLVQRPAHGASLVNGATSEKHLLFFSASRAANASVQLRSGPRGDFSVEELGAAATAATIR